MVSNKKKLKVGSTKLSTRIVLGNNFITNNHNVKLTVQFRCDSKVSMICWQNFHQILFIM